MEKVKQDLKEGETPESTGQDLKIDSTVETEEKSEETMEELKERLAKAEEERENYKQGLLSEKAKSRTLKTEKSVETTEEEKTFEESGLTWDQWTKLQAKKAADEAVIRAKSETLTEIGKINEKTAIKSILIKIPELQKDDVWQQVISRYSSFRGKENVDDIVLDLEDAYFLYKKDKGQLKELENLAYQKGKIEGITKAKTAELSEVGGQTKRSDVKDGIAITPQQEEMARRFRNDPKEVYKN